MATIISTDSFDAETTLNGIEIVEKRGTVKKFGLVIALIGILFIAISYIPLEELTYEWISTIFNIVFLWGGILLVCLGVILFILRGLLAKPNVSKFHKTKQELYLRGKVIPFNQITEISIQTQEVMNRTMTAIIIVINGRKKSLISGTLFSSDMVALNDFVSLLNEIIKKKER